MCYYEAHAVTKHQNNCTANRVRRTDRQTNRHTHTNLSVAVVGLQNMLELSVYQFGSEWIIFQVQCQSQKLSFNKAKKDWW